MGQLEAALGPLWFPALPGNPSKWTVNLKGL